MEFKFNIDPADLAEGLRAIQDYADVLEHTPICEGLDMSFSLENSDGALTLASYMKPLHDALYKCAVTGEAFRKMAERENQRETKRTLRPLLLHFADKHLVCDGLMTVWRGTEQLCEEVNIHPSQVLDLIKLNNIVDWLHCNDNQAHEECECDGDRHAEFQVTIEGEFNRGEWL